jgi:hypothetical protein
MGRALGAAVAEGAMTAETRGANLDKSYNCSNVTRYA